jgi:acyl-coenzyme A thioesterase PaaI-like protein
MTETKVLDPYTFGSEQRCFGCGPHHPIGFKLQFVREGSEIVVRMTPGADYEGPPGIMHGGLQTTLADELGAWTIIGLKDRMGFTTAIDVRLLRPARVGVELEGRGRIIADHGDRVIVAVIFKQGAATTLRGRISFVIPTAEGAEKILGMPLPEPWRRFGRSSDEPSPA